MKIYLVGSLQYRHVQEVAARLRAEGHEVFDDWQSCHPEADNAWRDYELARGRTYAEGLAAEFAENAFGFDLDHLNWAEVVILVTKPGKIGGFSAAAELTWARCNSKRTAMLLYGEPERWELMARLAVDPKDIFDDIEDLVEWL